jgi:TatD DNase family protein
MTPSNLYQAIPHVKGRLPICHTGMIPWTAEFVANVANEVGPGQDWGMEKVMEISRENAKFMYGI